MLTKSFQFVKQSANDLLYLFFPEACVCCGTSLLNQEKILCTTCRFKLPKTNFHKWESNPMEKHFWGRVNFEMANAYLYFGKETRVQELLHHLKYKGRDDVGTYIGELYGSDLKRDGAVDKIDFIIPVPLHPSRERFRGYNQAYMIGKGISEATGIPIRKDFYTGELPPPRKQKKQDLSDGKMWKKFLHRKTEQWKGKHLLLVDDVMTTGSTLEACSRVLLNNAEVKLSAATIAVAM